MPKIFLSVWALVVLLGGGLPAHAQSGEQTAPARVSWGGYAQLPAANGTTRKVPTFREAYHGPGELVGTFTLRVPGTVATGTLRDAVYEPFPAADAALLSAATLTAAPGVRLRFGYEARRPYSYVLVQPARRNPQTGQPERLVSFTYAYQTDGGGANRPTAPVARPHNIQTSVLNSGDWFKIGVPTSGMYKLDRDALGKLGINTGATDPRRIQVYGNATGMLPQANAAPRPDDLVENNVLLVNDNNDATFDANEFILFYAPGPHTWAIDSTNKVPTSFRHLNNVYSDTAYYFVRVGPAAGRRVPTAAAPAGQPTGAPITTFMDRRFYERDLVNLMHSGRHWLGETFSAGSSQSFIFSADGQPALTDLVVGSPARLRVAVAAATLQPSAFQVSLNGAALPGSTAITPLSNAAFSTVANTNVGTYTTAITSATNEPQVTLNFLASDPTASGYLDYLELLVQRQLRLSGSALEFRAIALRGAGSVGTYTVDNAGGAQVWEVTNPRRPRAQALSNGSFVAYTDSVREYVAFQPNGSFPTPRPFGRVANQNLHALNVSGDLDLVIVTYPAFRRQAERLAQHRRDNNGLKVEVVTTRQIYNEYSSGAQDVTAIRDLMKQVYDRNPDPSVRRNYLLLFGDASFDYKSSAFNDQSQQPGWWKSRRPFKVIDADLYNQNMVPTYESRESFLPVAGYRDNAEGVSSYSSEDYYGLLDDNEGRWEEFGVGAYESCDIGIGRLPVRPPRDRREQATNDDQARQVVDKIIAYDATASFGKWRNRMTLTADDNDPNIGMAFTIESETDFAPEIQKDEPAYNIRKAYLDLYPQVSVAAGQRSPAAEAAINDALDQGSLLIGYTGHGGPTGLADERIITTASLQALTNQNRLTFFVTGTCDLSTYDNPELTSAGETVLTDNVTGGAVGLFTTTRVVYANFNTQLVKSFYGQVLSRNAAGDLPLIGNASRMAKITAGPSGDLNNRNYTLLADPTTRLAYPRQRVVIDSINGRKVASVLVSLDTLKALSQARVSGHIENRGAFNAGFNGTADITIFDKANTVNTLGDQGGVPTPVQVQETVVYSGQARVSSGRFSVKFIVPKDINYSPGLGKISLYAADYTAKTDAQGYQLVPIGGAAKNAPGDTTPPEVRLFMDDDSFVSGGLTGVNTLLLGKLFDLSGINTSNAGVGHELTATLDNDPAKLVIVNDSYTAAVNDFTRGQIRYNYRSLAPGPHTIKVKAWDTYNNSAEGTVEFIAAQKESLALDHVLNYPNPFSNTTTFHFDHNRAGQELDVQVQIFTVAGRLVKTLHANVMTSTSHDKTITWNGRDDYEDQLARGVYVYRILVRSTADSQQVSKFEKLVLLN